MTAILSVIKTRALDRGPEKAVILIASRTLSKRIKAQRVVAIHQNEGPRATLAETKDKDIHESNVRLQKYLLKITDSFTSFPI